ncbi:MAG: hypothetical protein U0795_09350 [Pirellulales bacterium]
MRCGQFLQRYHECVDRREAPESDPQLIQHATVCPHCARWLAVQRLWEGRWESQSPSASIGADALPDWTSPLPDDPAEPAGLPEPMLPAVTPAVNPDADPYRMTLAETVRGNSASSLVRTVRIEPTPQSQVVTTTSLAEETPPSKWHRSLMSIAAAALVTAVAANQLAPIRTVESVAELTDESAGGASVAPNLVAGQDEPGTVGRSDRDAVNWDDGRMEKGDLVRRRNAISPDSMASQVWTSPVAPWTQMYAFARFGGLSHDPLAQWGTSLGLDRPWSMVQRPWDSVRSVRPDWVDPLVSQLKPLSRRMERAWSLLRRTWSGRPSDPVSPDASAAEERLELLRRVC